jgi:hypothetical protein
VVVVEFLILELVELVELAAAAQVESKSLAQMELLTQAVVVVAVVIYCLAQLELVVTVVLELLSFAIQIQN